MALPPDAMALGYRLGRLGHEGSGPCWAIRKVLNSGVCPLARAGRERMLFRAMLAGNACSWAVLIKVDIAPAAY